MRPQMDYAGPCRFASNCVYVYDKNYAIVIVTQQKKEELEIRFDRKTQCSFIIQIYKTMFVWV